MMNKIIFATHNQNKYKEIKPIIPEKIELLTLADIQCFDEIPETQDTIEGNALQKARYVFERYNQDCFADDTGLEVEALNGEPGIHSARYAGEEKKSDDNINLLLKKLKTKQNRKARFKTVIALIIDGKEYLFEGIVNGKIIDDKQGTDGFGYDPVFIPDGKNQTFAQMPLNEKNTISHRAIAVKKLINYLSEIV